MLMRTFVTLCVLSWLVTRGASAGESQHSGVYRVSELTGFSMKNIKGQDLGKVDDFVIDPTNGRITFVILAGGGFLGIGEKYFPIPWQALIPNFTDKTFTLDLDKDRLKTAPSFDKKSWPDLMDRSEASRIYQFYNVSPPGESSGGAGEAGPVAKEGSREGTTLPFKIEKGQSFHYTVMRSAGPGFSSPANDLEYRFNVKDVSAEETRLVCNFRDDLLARYLGFEEKGSGKDVSFTIHLGPDGKVKQVRDLELRSRERDLGQTEKLDSEVRSHLTYIFGSGLHGVALQKWQTYPLEPVGARTYETGKFSSPQESSGQAAAERRLLHEFFPTCRSLSFQGMESGKAVGQLAHFVFTPTTTRTGAVGTPSPKAGRESATTGRLGEAFYRSSDGLLQNLRIEPEGDLKFLIERHASR